MAYFNEDLQQLKDNVVQKKRAETELLDLYAQKRDLAGKVAQLEKIKREEQKDVDRLERGSLAAFFYNVVGKKEEKLTKEKEEAYKAAVKYETAKEELASVENEILRREELVKKLQGCEVAYQAAFDAKLKEVRVSGTGTAEQIMQVEAKLYQVECQKKEIDEAIFAGKQALNTVNEVLDSLDDAEGWATWDTFGGGGFLTDMMKHDHLDDAQSKINQLQVELRKLKTELADVEVHADIQVQIEDFLKFADYFFDGLFADWTVMDKIDESISEVKHTKSEILAVIGKLELKLEGLEPKVQRLQEELEKLVMSV